MSESVWIAVGCLNIPDNRLERHVRVFQFGAAVILFILILQQSLLRLFRIQ